MGFSWERFGLVLKRFGVGFGGGGWAYHSRPPERGAEGLNAPNMIVNRCCCEVSLPLMGTLDPWMFRARW